jgi:hypothetical protein
VRLNAEEIAYNIRTQNPSPTERLLANLPLLDLDEIVHRAYTGRTSTKT